jgi:3-oxoacyl-[acyl-carrier protein] reductase
VQTSRSLMKSLGYHASEVVRAVQSQDCKGVAIQADSADVATLQASIQIAVAELGGLDVLVNNAGIIRLTDLNDMSVEDIEARINVNVRSPIIASKAALSHLKEGGSIITIGSYFADRVPFSLAGVYAATKSAMIAFTKGRARELGQRAITVNLVQPGPIDTDMNPSDGPYSSGQVQLTASGRYSKPEEIADAVAFLSSPVARFITGTSLIVDGGLNA